MFATKSIIYQTMDIKEVMKTQRKKLGMEIRYEARQTI